MIKTETVLILKERTCRREGGEFCVAGKFLIGAEVHELYSTLQLTNFAIFNLKNIFKKIIDFVVFLNT